MVHCAPYGPRHLFMLKSLSEACLFITDSKPITTCWFMYDPGAQSIKKRPKAAHRRSQLLSACRVVNKFIHQACPLYIYCTQRFACGHTYTDIYLQATMFISRYSVLSKFLYSWKFSLPQTEAADKSDIQMVLQGCHSLSACLEATKTKLRMTRIVTASASVSNPSLFYLRSQQGVVTPMHYAVPPATEVKAWLSSQGCFSSLV